MISKPFLGSNNLCDREYSYQTCDFYYYDENKKYFVGNFQNFDRYVNAIKSVLESGLL